MDRRIIHLDMDAFFASVEQRDDPRLRGQPIAVGGTGGRGVVAAASYEARRYGVRSAMPTALALRLCPQLIVVAGRFSRYKEVSQQLQSIFLRLTDLVEAVSIDEAYLDVTENHLGERSATRLAEFLRAQIRQECGLTASAGVAGNKLVAKIASDRNKPDGLCVVPPDRAAAFLHALPAQVIPGIGPKTFARLLEHGLSTCGALHAAEPALLERLFGRHAERVRLRAIGIDESPVRVSRQRRSIGIEDTFAADLRDRAAAEAALRRLADSLIERCRRAEVHAAGGVTLKVKYHDFQVISRSRGLHEPLTEAAVLLRRLPELLDRTEVGRRPVRLLGLSLHRLQAGPSAPVQQLDLFSATSHS